MPMFAWFRFYLPTLPLLFLKTIPRSKISLQTNSLNSTMADLYVKDGIDPTKNDDVDRRPEVPSDVSPPPNRSSSHDKLLTASNISIYATSEELEYTRRCSGL